MASGTPVVTVPDPALVEVAGDAAVVVPERSWPRASAGRWPSGGAGGRRARAGAGFTWEATARATVTAYLEALAR